MIPDEVREQWVREAEHYLERQARAHKSNDHTWPMEECWSCERNRAICKSKVRFASLEEAQEWCDEVNYPTRSKLVRPYRCYWGPGLHWHMATAKGASARRRVFKRMAKLAMRGETSE